MRTLVTWGSKMGGTEGIARMVGEALRGAGVDVVLREASTVRDLRGYDAVVLGGALYANRWAPAARRFASRHEAALRERPVWVFSSGPLDYSAERGDIPPSHQVRVICERIGAREHVTFGGRLRADAQGFPASAMAKELAGDWRNPQQIRAWGAQIAEALPTARPGLHIDHPAHAITRLLGYGLLTWATGAGLLVGLRSLGYLHEGVVAYAVMAPAIAAVFSWLYFRALGARNPLPTAVTWTLLAALLDFVVLVPAVLELRLFTHLAAGWWPLVATFLVTFGVGWLMSTLPWPRSPQPTDATSHSR